MAGLSLSSCTIATALHSDPRFPTVGGPLLLGETLNLVATAWIERRFGVENAMAVLVFGWSGWASWSNIPQPVATQGVSKVMPGI